MDLTDEELNAYMDAYENASVDNWERVSMSKYWDWLPPEIQEYVTQLATTQYIRDNRRNKLWNNVCEEVLLYHKLKEEWGLGHIKIKVFRCKDYNNGKPKVILAPVYTLICGCYVDIHNVKRTHRLGSRTLKEALDSLPIRSIFLRDSK